MDPPPEEIARAIARGHAFQKHVLDRREFSGEEPLYGTDTGVRTREDFEAHLRNVLASRGTKGLESAEGYFYLYHKESNTFVFYDKQQRWEPTAFRPKKHDAYFNGIWAADCEFRQDWFRGRVSEKGGYAALLRNIGRKEPQREAESSAKKNAFELARERAANSTPPERGKDRGRDDERER